MILAFLILSANRRAVDPGYDSRYAVSHRFSACLAVNIRSFSYLPGLLSRVPHNETIFSKCVDEFGFGQELFLGIIVCWIKKYLRTAKAYKK